MWRELGASHSEEGRDFSRRAFGRIAGMDNSGRSNDTIIRSEKVEGSELALMTRLLLL